MTQQVITKKMALRQVGFDGSAEAVQPDPFPDRVLKLIPAEVVAAYIAVFQIMKSTKSEKWVYWLVFFLLLFANILYKKQVKVTDWRQWLITSIAYILWVFSLGGPIPGFHIGNQDPVVLSSILVPVFTLFVPFIYK